MWQLQWTGEVWLLLLLPPDEYYYYKLFCSEVSSKHEQIANTKFKFNIGHSVMMTFFKLPSPHRNCRRYVRSVLLLKPCTCPADCSTEGTLICPASCEEIFKQDSFSASLILQQSDSNLGTGIGDILSLWFHYKEINSVHQNLFHLTC